MKSIHAPFRNALRRWQIALLAPALLAAVALPASAQVLLEENFTFIGPLTSNGWTASSGAGTNPINSAAPGLTYPSLPSSGIGNAAAIGTTGEDDRKLFTSASTSGDVYASCLINVSAAQATGDYFYTLSSGTTGYIGRVFAKSSGSGFVLGIQKGSGTTPAPVPTYSTTVLNYNTTYLLVLKVKRNSGSATDDEASIWVDPVLGGVETAPLISNNQGNDQASIDSVVLRQGNASNAPTVKLGNILVGTTWASVTPLGNSPVIAPSGGYSPFSTFVGVASQSQGLTVGSSNLTASISASAPTGFEISTDNSSFGPSATLPSTGGILYARISAAAAEGEILSSITLSSAGATDVAVAVNGAVRPTSIALPYGPETFESTAFPWSTFTVAGSKSWVRSSAGGNSFMEINGYDAAPGALPSNAWLILGPFDIPAGVSNLVATFNLQRAFNDAGDGSELSFKYSADYTGEGDPASATWSDIPFTKPAAVLSTSTDFTPSGAVPLPPTLAGQSGIYVAFQLAATSPTATSRWRMDQFELFTSSLPVISIVANPTTINEGSTAVGTVFIPEAVGEDVIVTVTSADPALVLVDNGYGDPPASSCEVPIFAGETSALFTITTTRDFTPGSDVPVQIIADGGAAYTFGQTIVTVRNIDLPSVDLTAGGYSQDFSAFTAATPELPEGWALAASNQTLSAWANTTTGAKFSSDTVNVFGYQHSSSTGIVQQILTLRNATGETIDALTISYLGIVARTNEDRLPAYVVTVNGAPVPALAYSTSAGANIQTTASLTNLSIAPGQTVEIAWTSDRGFIPDSGTSRQIGIGKVSVQLGATLLPPTVSGLSIPTQTITRTSAAVAAEVTSDGGSPVTARGFVYAVATINPAPVIGGAGVVQAADASGGMGEISALLASLSPGTSYATRAYATNDQGTVYTSVQTFTTVSPAIAFGGNYAQPFNAFTGSIPTGWTAISSGNLQNYGGVWGTGSSAGLRGGVSNPGVIGYQHTASSGTFTVTASFINDTGAPITTLFVNYLGRVARADQPSQPAWAVSLDGNLIGELAYSTGNTAGPGGVAADELITAEITGLNIPAGADFSLSWVSDRGAGGTARQIGLANFQISTSEILPAEVSFTANLLPFATTIGTPSDLQTFTVSGANLFGDIALAAPAGFEISQDGNTYAPSVQLVPIAGTVGISTIRVRLTGADEGSFAGNITLASAGVATQNIAVTGTVSGGGSAYDTWASGFGLDPATTGAPTADPDGDSFSNEQEYAFGTNPTQGNGSLLSSTASGGNLVVTWLERSDVTYNVQSTGNLSTSFANDGTVSVVDGPVSPTPPAGYTSKQFTVPASGSKFYRVTAATP